MEGEAFSELPLTCLKTSPPKGLNSHESPPWKFHQPARTDCHRLEVNPTPGQTLSQTSSYLLFILLRASSSFLSHLLSPKRPPPSPVPSRIPEFLITLGSYSFSPGHLPCVPGAYRLIHLFFSC